MPIPAPGEGQPCSKMLPKAIMMTAVVLIKMCFGKLPKTW